MKTSMTKTNVKMKKICTGECSNFEKKPEREDMTQPSEKDHGGHEGTVGKFNVGNDNKNHHDNCGYEDKGLKTGTSAWRSTGNPHTEIPIPFI